MQFGMFINNTITFSFSPDGTYFASVSGDKTINIFDGKVYILKFIQW